MFLKAMKTDWNRKRVLILGAARQGLALARWLSLHGARVTLNDMRTADELRVARESLAEYQIDWYWERIRLNCSIPPIYFVSPVEFRSRSRSWWGPLNEASLSRTTPRSLWKLRPAKLLVLPAHLAKQQQQLW